MVVHIVYGLSNYEPFAILASFGLMIIIVSYLLYNREIAKEPSVLNLIGFICLVVAYNIVQLDDNSNWKTRSLYNSIISFGLGLFSGIFLVYNLSAWVKWNVKRFVENIWAEKDEERNRLN